MDEAEGKKFGINTDMTKNYASLSIVKNNYGPTDESYWLRRNTIESHSVSVLEHVNLLVPIAPLKGGEELQRRIISKIECQNGKFSRRGFIDAHTGKDSNLKATKRGIVRALDELIAQGEILIKSPTSETRKQFNLHHTIKETLHLNVT